MCLLLLLLLQLLLLLLLLCGECHGREEAGLTERGFIRFINSSNLMVVVVAPSLMFKTSLHFSPALFVSALSIFRFPTAHLLFSNSHPSSFSMLALSLTLLFFSSHSISSSLPF